MATILTIEDDEQEQRLLRVILTPAYQVVQAADVEEGIELAQLSRPDLVLLDLHRRGHQDGLDVCRALRRDLGSALARVPILMLTGANSETDIRTALAAGASSYLNKPYSPNVLLELVDTLLG